MNYDDVYIREPRAERLQRKQLLRGALLLIISLVLGWIVARGAEVPRAKQLCITNASDATIAYQSNEQHKAECVRDHPHHLTCYVPQLAPGVKLSLPIVEEAKAQNPRSIPVPQYPGAIFLPVTDDVVKANSFRQTGTANAHCGKERWPVKTLADPGANGAIALDPAPTTVHDLVQAPAPSRKDLEAATSVRYPVEVPYKLTALLLGFKEESDSDYHLVLADPRPPHVTMIAEIPAPDCAPAAYAGQFGAARLFVQQHWRQPTAKYYHLAKPALVTIEGVGFFDFLHGQTGVAKNGFEIHPVLEITEAAAQ